MKTCSAYFCKNTSKNPSIRFYKFPETAVRSEWVKAMRCKRAPGKKAYVCSAHFEDDCYIKKTIKLNRIRDDAIPTIFSKLPPSYSTPVNSSELLKENEMDVYPTYKSFRNDSTYTPNLLDIKIEKSESLLNLEEYEILKERDPSAEEFCRLCLGKLYSGRVPIWEDRDISERICKCTSIQVLPTDYLKFICALCSENIMKINAFQEMCVQSNEAFENYKYRYRDMTDSPFPKIKEEIETSEEVTAEIEYESECDFKFTNDFCDSEKFEKEENEKTGVDELFCEVCPMVCYDPGEMEAHLRSHETRTIFHCSFPKCDVRLYPILCATLCALVSFILLLTF